MDDLFLEDFTRSGKATPMKFTSMLICFSALLLFAGILAQSLRAEVPRRLIAIDNVCAWPNLVKMKDGTLVTVVFNQPNHGRTGEPTTRLSAV